MDEAPRIQNMGWQNVKSGFDLFLLFAYIYQFTNILTFATCLFNLFIKTKQNHKKTNYVFTNNGNNIFLITK